MIFIKRLFVASLLLAGLLANMQAMQPRLSVKRHTSEKGHSIKKNAVGPYAHLTERWDECLKQRSTQKARSRRDVEQKKPSNQGRFAHPSDLRDYINQKILNEGRSLKALFIEDPEIARYMIENRAYFADFFGQLNAASRCRCNPKIKQFAVREQNEQGNFSCGLHATHNAICFLLAQYDSEVAALLNNDDMFNISNAVCLSVAQTIDFSGKQGLQMVYNLLKALEDVYEIEDEAREDVMVMSVEQAECLKFNMQRDENGFRPGDKDLYAKHFKSREHYDTLVQQIQQKRECLMSGRPQVFIIDTNGHWLPFKVQLVAEKSDSVRVWTANSYRNDDATNINSLDRILKIMGIERII